MLINLQSLVEERYLRSKGLGDVHRPGSPG